MTIHLTHALAAVAAVATFETANAGAQDACVYVGGAGMLSPQGSHRQGTEVSLPRRFTSLQQIDHLRVRCPRSLRCSDDPSHPGWALGLSSIILRPAIGLRAAF